MKRDLLDIDLGTFSGVRNFGIEISYEGHPFFENVGNLMQISKMQEKIDKKLFVFKIIASELVALNSLY